MIRIVKPITPPSILHTRGRQATRDLCAAYEQGERTFDFDRTLFAAPSVKTALQQAQHNKCAFCESKFVHVGYGDVEHFRPKAGFQQGADDTLVRPGYYWLAYEWSNLFFSCQLCNQSFKRNRNRSRVEGDKRTTGQRPDQ